MDICILEPYMRITVLLGGGRATKFVRLDVINGRTKLVEKWCTGAAPAGVKQRSGRGPTATPQFKIEKFDSLR